MGRIQIMQPGCLSSERSLSAPSGWLHRVGHARHHARRSSCSSPAKSAGGASSTTSATSATSRRATTTVWLCKPGVLPDPCLYANNATSVAASGAESPARRPRRVGLDSIGVRLFLRVPDSEQPAAPGTGNTDLTVGSPEVAAAAAQASPFSRVCNVWAPMYRPATTQSIEEGLGGNTSLLHSTFTVAYNSLLSAWNDFIAHDDDGTGDPDRGLSRVSHPDPSDRDAAGEPASVLGRLVVVIIAGGNLQVPGGKSVGATFSNVPLCTSAEPRQGVSSPGRLSRGTTG